MNLDEADSGLNDVVKRINNFASEREWGRFHSPKNLAASISIEASELLEIFQWTNHSRDEICGDEILLKQISEEIADVMIYCLRLGSTLGLDQISIINDKIELNGRKYPISESKGNHKKSSNSVGN